MHGTSTALVILVPEAERRLGAFRRAHDRAAGTGSLAHITLLYPFLRQKDLTTRVDATLAALFARYEAFSFRLQETGRFRGVLHLLPEPAAPFIALTQAIWQAFPDHPPYEGRFSRITPHLQLAQGDDEALLDHLEAEFHSRLGPLLPIHGRAEAVQLIDEQEGRWNIRCSFQLAGGQTGTVR